MNNLKHSYLYLIIILFAECTTRSLSGYETRVWYEIWEELDGVINRKNNEMLYYLNRINKEFSMKGHIPEETPIYVVAKQIVTLNNNINNQIGILENDMITFTGLATG